MLFLKYTIFFLKNSPFFFRELCLHFIETSSDLSHQAAKNLEFFLWGNLRRKKHLSAIILSGDSLTLLDDVCDWKKIWWWSSGQNSSRSKSPWKPWIMPLAYKKIGLKIDCSWLPPSLSAINLQMILPIFNQFWKRISVEIITQMPSIESRAYTAALSKLDHPLKRYPRAKWASPEKCLLNASWHNHLKLRPPQLQCV